MPAVTSSSWLLQIPQAVEDLLYSRNDLQIVEETKPMKRAGEEGPVIHHRKRYLCVPEGLRFVGATQEPTATGVDLDYLRGLTSAARTIANDPFFSSRMGAALPLGDLYAWPSIIKELGPAVAARVRWLENTGARAKADQLKKAMALLSSEVSFSGLINLDDASEAILSSEVVCKRYRAESLKARQRGVDVLTPAVIGDGRDNCDGLWSMPQRYQRKLLLSSELHLLARAVSPSTSESIQNALRSFTKNIAPMGENSSTATLFPMIGVAQFLSIFPQMDGSEGLVQMLASACASSSTNQPRRWYLRSGVGLSLVAVNEVVFASASATTLLGSHPRLKESESVISSSALEMSASGAHFNMISWSAAIRQGLVITTHEKVGQQANQSATDLVQRAGILSKFPAASIKSIDEPTISEGDGALSLKVVRVSFSNNFFFVVHGPGVAEGLPLPSGVLVDLEAAAAQDSQW